MAHLHVALALTGAVLFVCAEMAAASFAAPAVLDVDTPMQNEAAFQDTMRCVFGGDDYKVCDSNSVSIKCAIPDALKTDCSQCNEKQKAQTEKVIRFLINEKPDLWKSLQDKYDPDGTYKRRHEAELKKLSS